MKTKAPKDKSISKKKQKLIDAKNNSELIVGERIYVLEKAVYSYKEDSDNSCLCTISSLQNGITVYVGSEQDKNTTLHKITKAEIVSRDLLCIGANPFEENVGNIRLVAYGIDSILFKLDVLSEKSEGRNKYSFGGIEAKECNWNPFIYAKDGKKQYYQRPFVWSIADKQLLIESIYHNIDCGKILVRMRGWGELEKMQKNGETDLAFCDIVDGKQRLNAIKCFIEGEFADLQGNYYSDLSFMSQNKFTNHQLFSYAEMPENTKDEDVINQFLKLNFAGVPQSKSHIDFVKAIYDKI